MAALIQMLLKHPQRVLEMGQSRGVFHVTFYPCVLITSVMMSHGQALIVKKVQLKEKRHFLVGQQ